MADTQLDALAGDPEIKPLLDQPWLRYHERQERSREIEEVDRVLRTPEARKGLANPGRLAQQNQQRKRVLEDQTPPPLTPSQRAKLERLNRLAQTSGLEGMPSQEEVRHKPPGTVDKCVRWNREKKQVVIWWKRSQQLLHPDSQDRELGNFERFRPSRPTQDLMGAAQIPGVFTLSPEAKSNYDRIDWPHKGETFDEMAARLRAAGYTVRRRKAGLRAPKDGGKVYECPDTACDGWAATGPMGAARWAKHQKSHERKLLIQEGGGT